MLPKFLTIFLLLFFNQSFADDKKIFEAMKSKDWVFAYKLALQSGNAGITNLVLSQKYLDIKFPANKFESVIDFVLKNPHWPQVDKIKIIAESYLNEKTDKRKIMLWFSKNKPQTGNGYKYYALSAVSLEKDLKKLSEIIKLGWIFGDFDIKEEAKFLKSFESILSRNDHIKRIEEHLWKDDIDEARRSFHLIDDFHVKAFEVAIQAIESSENTEAAFLSLTEKQHIPVVVYKYLEYKKKLVTDDLIPLFAKADKYHQDNWGRLQIYYAREFLDTKDYNLSYKVLQKNIRGDFETERAWLMGWLALKLSKYNEALEHFKHFTKISRKPISIAKGKYWIARAYEALNNTEDAKKYYKLASKYSYTFYGQMASIEMNQKKLILPSKPQIDASHKRFIENNDVMKAIKFLIKFGKSELAHLYAKSAIEIAKSKGEIALICDLIRKQGSNYYTVEFAKAATQKDVFIKDAAYPSPFNLKNTPIEHALTYGIIRQESVFNQYAVSDKNAMGLMQLIKSTACTTAKILNEKCDIFRLTKDINYNIRLGTHNLKELIQERKGSYILAIASYNTASRNVDKWIPRFGDPRSMKNFRDIVDWIELIPFSETRNYVQRVLEAAQVYRVILGKEQNIRLKEDLLRGT